MLMAKPPTMSEEHPDAGSWLTNMTHLGEHAGSLTVPTLQQALLHPHRHIRMRVRMYRTLSKHIQNTEADIQAHRTSVGGWGNAQKVTALSIAAMLGPHQRMPLEEALALLKRRTATRDLPTAA